jgi:hypothetical protein
MIQSSFINPLVLFLVTLGFGFWVSKHGKPYHSILFNIHKLVALAGVVLTGMRIRSGFLPGPLSGWIIATLVAVVLSVFTLFATGAIMSIRDDEPGPALWVHRVGPVIIVICLLVMYYLF